MDGCAHNLPPYTGKQADEVDSIEPFTKRLGSSFASILNFLSWNPVLGHWPESDAHSIVSYLQQWFVEVVRPSPEELRECWVRWNNLPPHHFQARPE